MKLQQKIRIGSRIRLILAWATMILTSTLMGLLVESLIHDRRDPTMITNIGLVCIVFQSVLSLVDTCVNRWSNRLYKQEFEQRMMWNILSNYQIDSLKQKC
jgi:hypothetical protein